MSSSLTLSQITLMRNKHTTKVISNFPRTNFSCGSTYTPTQAINLAILPSSLKWQQSSYSCVEGTVSISGSRRIPCWQWQFTLWSQGKRQDAEPLDFPQKASFSPDLESLTSSLCSSGSELLTNWSAPPSVFAHLLCKLCSPHVALATVVDSEERANITAALTDPSHC